jgi:hypothetical protein
LLFLPLPREELKAATGIVMHIVSALVALKLTMVAWNNVTVKASKTHGSKSVPSDS